MGQHMSLYHFLISKRQSDRNLCSVFTVFTGVCLSTQVPPPNWMGNPLTERQNEYLLYGWDNMPLAFTQEDYLVYHGVKNKCIIIIFRSFCKLPTADGVNGCTPQFEGYYDKYIARCSAVISKSSQPLCGCFPKTLGMISQGTVHTKLLLL